MNDLNPSDLVVLRALARLSRMRKIVDFEALALRAGGTLEDARGAIGRLARSGFVERRGEELRLTMAGLAVAVASGASRARVEKPARGPRAAKRHAA
jgi:RIO-like serine/threonine protein kinase